MQGIPLSKAVESVVSAKGGGTTTKASKLIGLNKCLDCLAYVTVYILYITASKISSQTSNLTLKQCLAESG